MRTVQRFKYGENQESEVSVGEFCEFREIRFAPHFLTGVAFICCWPLRNITMDADMSLFLNIDDPLYVELLKIAKDKDREDPQSERYWEIRTRIEEISKSFSVKDTSEKFGL